MRVRELADWLGSTFEGDGETELTGVKPLETAGAEDLAFVSSSKIAKQAADCAAGCLIVPFDFPPGRTLIRASAPRTAFARAVSRLLPPAPRRPGVHPSASIHPQAEVAQDVEIAAHVSVGEGTRIESGCSIGAGCSIGSRVLIGSDSVLHAHVTIYDDVDIGRGAILHAGCVIGADGFGFVLDNGRYEKFPQIGRVEIGAFVEIGANSCVDRAALGTTFIGEGTKLDNMVHVGHNCRIGRHVVVAAQTGFSGGVVVDDYAVIGGQVGIGDKARIESHAVLGSGCGILTSKIVRSGNVVWGTPARPLKQYLEQLAYVARLPQMNEELAEIKQRLSALEKAET
jgi:UDP-3-O-[3-hydroxymyristoyl] glucosamine N-acyltransferase